VEVDEGALDGPPDAPATQAFLSGSYGVLAIKQIPLFTMIRNNPGIYLLRVTENGASSGEVILC